MKILLLGRDGQVGWELQRSLAPLGELFALGRNALHNPEGLCGDLTDLDGLRATVRTVRPQIIVNAAAHTAVDKAESETGLAHLLNAQAPGVLAQEAQAVGAWLVHYSTDYVFDGNGEAPWQESDATGPLSVYGRTKLEGEQAIAAACPRHLIFRTCWVYAARGNNFAKTMLRLAQTRDTMNVIDDQIGSPTGADLIADVTAQALGQVRHAGADAALRLAGIYHLAASGVTSWFSYANYVLAQAVIAQPAIKIIAKNVNPVASSAFPTAARRPHNSRLNTSRLQTVFGLQLPSWQVGVTRMLNEIDHGPKL